MDNDLRGTRGMMVWDVVDSFLRTGVVSTSCTGDEVLEYVMRSISGTNRFNALTKMRVSVMAHSWAVGEIACRKAPVGMRDEARLCGMMHDFGETIVGDFTMPMKTGVFREVYERNYLPLEVAFREYVGETVLGIHGFKKMYAYVDGFVQKADKFVGDLEYRVERGTTEEEMKLLDWLEGNVLPSKFLKSLRILVEKVSSAT